MKPCSIIFSIGKHVTAAMLLRLAERGELDLDAPARLYLPEADFEGYDVTTRQLLSHTSGLWGRNETRMISLPAISTLPLMVRSWSGPTRASVTPLLSRDRAPAYFVEAGETHRIAAVDPEWFGGAGTVCGTAGDLMRWWFALRSGRIVNAGSLDQMFGPSRLRRNGIEADFGYGLGVRLGEYAGYRKIGHTGSGSGGTSVLAEYPDAGLTILVITNTAGDGVRNAYELEAAIASTLLGADTQTMADARIPDDLLRAAPGLYRSPLDRFCVSARGAELWRSAGNASPERLRHVGGGRFTAADDADGAGRECFLGIETGSAQWFAYDRYGFPDDLAVRVDDECSVSDISRRTARTP